MINVSGWGLTGRLISKHFGSLGQSIASTIAGFDPETATQADRDRLQGLLQQSATRLAAARVSFKKEADDVASLQALIATDTVAAEALLARLAAGKISEAAVMLFCDELEANKSRLPAEQAEAEQAQAFVGELEKLVSTFSDQLARFDAQAKSVQATLRTAEAQRDVERARRENLVQLSGLRANADGASTALSTLARRAERISTEAAGLKIVTDIQQKPLDDALQIDEIRRAAASGVDTAKETTIDRLRRLTGRTEAQV